MSDGSDQESDDAVPGKVDDIPESEEGDHHRMTRATQEGLQCSPCSVTDKFDAISTCLLAENAQIGVASGAHGAPSGGVG